MDYLVAFAFTADVLASGHVLVAGGEMHGGH
jgi:hypothetical protein